jgi:glutathione S-transferase
MDTFLIDAKLGLPPSLLVRTAGPIIRLGDKLNQSNDDHVRAELERLPAALDRVDGWIAEGVLNGEELNAADFQIATTVRLLMAFDDLRPLIEGRPAAALAARVLPDASGRVPPIYPREWLVPLGAGAAA